jgi:hypothetical protein
MRNDGGVFTDISAGSGVDLLTFTSVETVTYDFDNDGNLDLVSGNNIMFGDGNMNFTLHTEVFPGTGAYGDVNNDGYIDAFNSGNIYINNKETNNNWIKIHTVGTTSNANGIGARVEIHTDSGVQIRDVKSGDGFRYMSSLNTHFGIGADTSISHIIVYWPNSDCETYINPPINQPFTAVEGAGASCDTLGVNDEAIALNLIVSPNPTKDILNISSSMPLNEDTIYTIYDISGRQLMNKKLENQTIDLSALSSGNYILRVISGKDVKTHKFIKQ